MPGDGRSEPGAPAPREGIAARLGANAAQREILMRKGGPPL